MTSQSNPELERTESEEITLFDRTFRDDTGRIVIGQPPNPPLITGILAILLQLFLPDGKLKTSLDWIAFGALFTWAWQELFEGVNYFRRGLGLSALISLILQRIL